MADKYLDLDKLAYFWSKIRALLGNKVDKVSGKGLSTNDFTTAMQNKLTNIEAGAEVNVQSDWNVTSTSSDAYIKNKPTLGTAAAANTTMSIASGSTGLPTSGTVYSVTGDKTSLTTAVKTDLVSAINEVNGTIGNINAVLEEVL